MCWRPTGRLFEKARVSLEEEYMVEKVEAEGTEIEECGYKAPVL